MSSGVSSSPCRAAAIASAYSSRVAKTQYQVSTQRDVLRPCRTVLPSHALPLGLQNGHSGRQLSSLLRRKKTQTLKTYADQNLVKIRLGSKLHDLRVGGVHRKRITSQCHHSTGLLRRLTKSTKPICTVAARCKGSGISESGSDIDMSIRPAKPQVPRDTGKCRAIIVAVGAARIRSGAHRKAPGRTVAPGGRVSGTLVHHLG